MADSLEESFKTESPLRSYKIVCDDRVFHVNGHSLSELSPYFETLFFGPFRESNEKTVTIPTDSNISATDVLEYLLVLYRKKEVRDGNCLLLIRLADVWDTPDMRKSCGKFLESGLFRGRNSPSLEFSIEVLAAALQHGLKSSVLELVNYIGKTAKHSYLLENKFLTKVTDPGTVASIFELVGKYSSPFMAHEYYRVTTKTSTGCDVEGCRSKGCHECSHCEDVFLCDRHFPIVKNEYFCERPVLHLAAQRDMELDLNLFIQTFNEESPFRKPKIICGDRTFFVNGFFLGEQSPYFEKLFYGDFKESDAKVLTISPESNISAEDVLEYLSVVYGRKEVTVSNATCIIRMGDVWDTPSVRAKCANFLESDYWFSLRSNGTLLTQCIDILEAALVHDQKKSIANLVEFIGKHTIDMLKRERFLEKIDDKGVIAAAFALAATPTSTTNHTWVSMGTTQGRYCHCGLYGTFYCSNVGCVHYACNNHVDSISCLCSLKNAPFDKSILFGDIPEKECTQTVQ